MSTDGTVELVARLADQAKAAGVEYRIEIQPTPTDLLRVTSVGYVERDRPASSALDQASDEDLLDELRDRLEDR